jgi:hypothetical protein
MGLNRSRTFGLWSKCFAGISDSRGLSVNRGKSGRTIIAIVFRLSFRCFFSYNITRFLLVILT